ncbi:hypothetical protein EOD23_39060 [Mesorhizobium sp. USDA-HM6]|uniref:hypothetical protein n=1 Tax=unclassified Mesorhizobium TaxID=325217 RepID=UPI000FCAFB7A|nr:MULTISPECIES: hypothetical protein [unclassified Mesorhizobium]RUT81106.1 hypothetical protein EOD23_39060 [Mesorhizobium sp. USDA-HM6]RUW22609.1 hypothetical protein EOA34_20950 [Mesorhizobium sp. M4B.F.Ca.ET.013.02.1.1]RVD46333.1 hypothetical protein EN741_01495 [Mesorhizobium sp. M4B.F.Ca.ET.019.03.1.1]RWF59688.1 MAG: hypothetical protein EOS47_32205 [Mesorhizobium sp.]RWX57946.1 hypothetical protein EN780_38300 [Mesorhizobium sp. M4B.F.Ca.ET.089.01.1.1]
MKIPTGTANWMRSESPRPISVSYAADDDNAALKTFAQETLPTLKMQKEMIDIPRLGRDNPDGR